MTMAACSPSGVRAASTVVLGPWLRGAWATARSPRGAQPYRGVRARLQPLSSTLDQRLGFERLVGPGPPSGPFGFVAFAGLEADFFVRPPKDAPQHSRQG